MNEIELSKLPKDLIIDILLKLNEGNFYKIVLKDFNEETVQEYYVKCVSEDDVIQYIPRCEEIKLSILKIWKEQHEKPSNCMFYLNLKNGKIYYLNYRRHNWSPLEWKQIRDEEFDTMAYEHFHQLFYDLFVEYISIKKIDILEMISK